MAKRWVILLAGTALLSACSEVAPPVDDAGIVDVGADVGATEDVPPPGPPCLEVESTHIDFGAQAYDACASHLLTLTACGEAPVWLAGAQVVHEGPDDAFGLDWAPSAELCGAAAGPTAAVPCLLQPGESATVEVTYCPSTLPAMDPVTGAVDDHEHATLTIVFHASQAGDGPMASLGQPYVQQVSLSGFGVEEECPQAVIELGGSSEGIPGQALPLRGDKSFVPGGGEAWFWSAKASVGSQPTFFPSANHPNVAVQLDKAGEVQIQLEVRDSKGRMSCTPAQLTILFLPEDMIHVELLWDTPADPDQSDGGLGAGADLDLHYASPLADSGDLDGDGQADPWFDVPYDTYWLNPNPNWGDQDPSVDDNPSLDLDDTDGAGPENLHHNQPADGSYTVGAHYANAHGLGLSYATINVYILGILAYQTPKVALQECEMWLLGRVQHPNTMTHGPGHPDPIVPCYRDPATGAIWQDSGDWCISTPQPTLAIGVPGPCFLAP